MKFLLCSLRIAIFISVLLDPLSLLFCKFKLCESVCVCVHSFIYTKGNINIVLHLNFSLKNIFWNSLYISTWGLSSVIFMATKYLFC